MGGAEHYPNAAMLTSRDMQKSIAFYRDTLGFELEGCWPDESKAMWANMMLDRQSIMLGLHIAPDEVKGMCGGDESMSKHMETLAREFVKNQPGVGVTLYVKVPDVDAYHAGLGKKGLKNLDAPKSQFYGLREFCLQDPDGYRLMMYTPITMTTCQSCSMPLEKAAPGQMYCNYCVDEQGKLKPYEVVLQGCIEGYFIPMQKMARPQAEKAAREMLAKQPAWHGRS